MWGIWSNAIFSGEMDEAKYRDKDGGDRDKVERNKKEIKFYYFTTSIYIFGIKDKMVLLYAPP